MFQRLFILLFIIANLSSQVSVAYACAMTGSSPKVMTHCCCKDVRAALPSDTDLKRKSCCQTVVEIDPSAGDEASFVTAPPKPPDLNPHALPALLPVLFALLLPPQSAAAIWNASRDDRPHGTDLYLRTQRLRL